MRRSIVEAQRYIGARESFVSRLLDEGGASRDFSLLEPEHYVTAARTAARAALAEVFARTVFDPLLRVPIPYRTQCSAALP